MSTSVDLSVIVVNWNTAALLDACLGSIERQDIALARDVPVASLSAGVGSPKQPMEVIVVDNGSVDDSLQMVRAKFPKDRLIANPENNGFARANNQALQMASGRYVLLLNSDTVVHPDAFETLISFMDANPRAGACSGRLLNTDGSLQHASHPALTPEREFWRLIFFDKFWPRATYPMSHWSTVLPRRVEVLKGAALMLRRSALDQVGMLDEDYFMYTEEVDLCRRLDLAGWELWYVPAARVTHFGGASSSQIAEAMYLQLYRSKLQYYRKFGGGACAWRAKVLYAVAYVPRWITSAVLGTLSIRLRQRARLYRRLLSELSSM